MSNEKDYTWKELKEFINQLPEEVLDLPVRWWGDERGGKIHKAECLKEEYAMNDEGWQPKSVLEPDDFTTQEEIDEYPSMPKGSPILHTD